ncbi:MAG: hypothetical protein HQL69_07740 [Magnetococcales bacterium]|nr:hypothetical protein [Magnetococcales bacterium]
MKDKTKKEAKHLLNYAEGYAACIEAVLEDEYEKDDECPYEDGSHEEQSWHHGWKKVLGIIK